MKTMIIFGAMVIALITSNVTVAKEVADEHCGTSPRVVIKPPKSLDLLREKSVSQDLNKSNMQLISTQINSQQINQTNIKLNNN
ncbi:MAG: hypothetical protein WBP46_02600 [Thiolinea sp.]